MAKNFVINLQTISKKTESWGGIVARPKKINNQSLKILHGEHTHTRVVAKPGNTAHTNYHQSATSCDKRQKESKI